MRPVFDEGVDLEDRECLRNVGRGHAGVEKSQPEVEVHRQLELFIERTDPVEAQRATKCSRLRQPVAEIERLSDEPSGRANDLHSAAAANLAITVGPPRLGLGREGLDNTLDCLRNEPVVGVQPADVVAGRERESLVEGIGLASVGLGDDGRATRAGELDGAVGRPSVDDDVLDVGVALRGEGVETARRTGRPDSGTE